MADLRINNSNEIEMTLNDEPFYQIFNGIKTVEVRLFDEKRQKLRVGDTINFLRKGHVDEFIKANIISLHRFDCFRNLFLSDLFSKTGFNGYTVEEATEKMYDYYRCDEEEKFGVLAIEIMRQ